MTPVGRFSPSLSIAGFRVPGRQPSPRIPSDNWDPSLKLRGWTGLMGPSCHWGHGVERAVQGRVERVRYRHVEARWVYDPLQSSSSTGEARQRIHPPVFPTGAGVARPQVGSPDAVRRG